MCRIEAKTLKELCPGLTKTLLHLDLSYNKIMKEGIDYLANHYLNILKCEAKL